MRPLILVAALLAAACGSSSTPTAPPPPATPVAPAAILLIASPPTTSSGTILLTLTVTDAEGRRLPGGTVHLVASSGTFDAPTILTLAPGGQAQTLLREAIPPAVRVEANIINGPATAVTVDWPAPPPPPPAPGYTPPPTPAPVPAPVPVPESFTLIAWPNLAPAGSTITLEAQPRGITLLSGWSIAWDWNGDGVVDSTAGGGLYGALAMFVTVPTPMTFTPQAWLRPGDGRVLHVRGNEVK